MQSRRAWVKVAKTHFKRVGGVVASQPRQTSELQARERVSHKYKVDCVLRSDT